MRDSPARGSTRRDSNVGVAGHHVGQGPDDVDGELGAGRVATGS